MLPQFRAAAMMLLFMTILTGGIYPLIVTGIAQVAFPHAANGSLIDRESSAARQPRSDVAGPQELRYSGSELIGQSFTRPDYFWGRLSATAPVPYNAAASGGSNFGPLHPDLKTAAEARIAALEAGGALREEIPVDLVTSSGSGLDPHISPAAALVQAPRIAASRKMSVDAVKSLVVEHTLGRQLGMFGEPRVNVLSLNLALDRLQSK